MATLKKTDLWVEGEPYEPYINVTHEGVDRVILRQNARRPPHKISKWQQAAMNALGKTSRYFKEELTPAKKLQWGTKGDTLTARDGVTTWKWGMTRWTQVQMPLEYTGLAWEDTNAQRNQTQIRNLRITNTEHRAEDMYVEVSWEWRRSGTSVERVAMHVSQVPRQYLQRESLWKYADYMETYHTYLLLSGDIWYPWSRWFWLISPVDVDDLLQLYIRINHFKNTNPPITKQESTLSVEPWWTLIVHVT